MGSVSDTLLKDDGGELRLEKKKTPMMGKRKDKLRGGRTMHE